MTFFCWLGLGGLVAAIITAEYDYLMPGIRASWLVRRRA